MGAGGGRFLFAPAEGVRRVTQFTCKEAIEANEIQIFIFVGKVQRSSFLGAGIIRGIGTSTLIRNQIFKIHF